jgi:hypothetical protein
MRRQLTILAAAALLLTACTPDATGGGTAAPPTTGAPTTTEVSPTTAGPPAAEAPPAAGPAATSTPVGDYRVTYGWAVPSERATVSHTVNPPPLPYLAEIHTGDHGTENPGYARISFYFRVGFPSYNVQYVRQVLTEGRGDPLPLEGNAALRVGFVEASTHDDNGRSTIVAAAPTHIGFRNLKSYGFAGDFEGYVTYGLGIQVAPNSDQVLPIRVGELRKPDGRGGWFYVVAVDVRAG